MALGIRPPSFQEVGSNMLRRLHSWGLCKVQTADLEAAHHMGNPPRPHTPPTCLSHADSLAPCCCMHRVPTSHTSWLCAPPTCSAGSLAPTLHRQFKHPKPPLLHCPSPMSGGRKYGQRCKGKPEELGCWSRSNGRGVGEGCIEGRSPWAVR